MKNKYGYISNSSSTSFLVAEDLTDKGIVCCLLSRLMVRMIAVRLVNEYFAFFDNNRIGMERQKRIDWLMRHTDHIYATQMLDETSEIYIKKNGKNKKISSIAYLYGDSDKPYNDKSHKILDKGKHSVWILNDDCPDMDLGVPLVEACERINDICGEQVAFKVELNHVKLWKPGHEPGGRFDLL